MNKVLLNNSFNYLSFDWFVWSNPLSIINADSLIYLPLSNTDLKIMSEKIYENSLNILEEIPDYFKEFEEPFVTDPLEIYENPLFLNSYFKESQLWRDFLIEELSIILRWDMGNYKYLLIGINDVQIIDGELFLIFYASTH